MLAKAGTLKNERGRQQIKQHQAHGQEKKKQWRCIVQETDTRVT